MKWWVVLAAVLLAGCASAQPSPAGTAPSSPAPSSPAPASPAALPADLLPGEQWLLVGGQTTPDATPFSVTLSFADGKVAGKGPVNTYSGPVTVGPGTLQVGALMSTKMGGPEPAMAAEQAYLTALQTVSTWEVADSTLTLLDATGSPVLVYAAPGSPGTFAVGLIGLPVKQATSQIAQAGYEARVISVDGDMRPVTMDFRPDRINLTVVDGVVTMASVG